MDQIRIGKFIAACRKEKGMTQVALAEKLGITDRAISKWETGKSMPDYGIMPQLCEELNINVNELISGEKIMAEEYNKHAEKALLEMTKTIEGKDKHLLHLEFVIGYISSVSFLILIFTAAYIEMPVIVRAFLIIIGFVIFVFAMQSCIKIEQVAGYYECPECQNRYIPTSYLNVFLAPHIGRTRYMKCPNCGKRHWQKKVLSKEENQ